MTIRHFATIAGLITLLLVTALGLTRYENPEPYMIVSDTSGDAFLYHEALDDLISVTADWGDYKFANGQIGSDKSVYATTSDGWLVMLYRTSHSRIPVYGTFFRYHPSGNIRHPLMPDHPEAGLLALSPDGHWMILGHRGNLYRQRVGSSDQAELITEISSLTFRGWLPDNQTMILIDYLSEEPQIYLLDFLTGDMQQVEIDGVFLSLFPSLEPGWYLLRLEYDSGEVVFNVNFTTGERIELLPFEDRLGRIAGFDASRNFLVYITPSSDTFPKLWRVDSNEKKVLILSDVEDVDWSSDHTILAAITKSGEERELWLIPTDTWIPDHIYSTSMQHFDFWYWWQDGFLFIDGNRVIFASIDGTIQKTLYELPLQNSRVRGTSPDGKSLLIEGQDVNYKMHLFKIRLDGSQMKSALPEEFDYDGIHGWLPVASYEWHVLLMLLSSTFLMMIGWRGLQRRSKSG